MDTRVRQEVLFRFLEQKLPKLLLEICMYQVASVGFLGTDIIFSGILVTFLEVDLTLGVIRISMYVPGCFSRFFR